MHLKVKNQEVITFSIKKSLVKKWPPLVTVRGWTDLKGVRGPKTLTTTTRRHQKRVLLLKEKRGLQYLYQEKEMYVGKTH